MALIPPQSSRHPRSTDGCSQHTRKPRRVDKRHVIAELDDLLQERPSFLLVHFIQRSRDPGLVISHHVGRVGESPTSLTSRTTSLTSSPCSRSTSSIRTTSRRSSLRSASHTFSLCSWADTGTLRPRQMPAGPRGAGRPASPASHLSSKPLLACSIGCFRRARRGGALAPGAVLSGPSRVRRPAGAGLGSVPSVSGPSSRCPRSEILRG